MADWPLLSVSRVGQDDTALASYTKQITNPGSTNVKGAWTEFIAALPFTISALLLTANVNNNFALVDIGIGAGGSEVVVFPNLQVGAQAGQLQTAYWIPISIPRGQRVALRVQSPTTSINAFVKLQLLADGFAGIQAPQRWESWGVDLATSQGAVITSGAINTKGTAVELVAASAFTTKWLALSLQRAGLVVNQAIDILVGAGVVIPNLHWTNQANQQFFGPFPYAIPRASQVQARSAATTAATTMRLQAWGGA